MTQATDTPAAFVFMKVGDHAGEPWDKILERKGREYERTGRIFWGYGGTVCHPIHQVQPFVRKQAKKHGAIYLLMEPVHSVAVPQVAPATEYSEDGVIWRPIPEGIKVTGSRYALVLGEICPGDLEVRTNNFTVGVGPSRGKRASDYIQGRVDKACLEFSPSASADDDPLVRVARFRAELLEPYAVLLRGEK